jgi:hypothetical protein
MLVPLRLPQYSVSRSPQQLDLVAVEEWEQSRSPTFALVVMVSSDPPRRGVSRPRCSAPSAVDSPCSGMQSVSLNLNLS